MEPTAETATAEDAAFREVMDDLFLDDAEADQLATLYEAAITAAEARAEARGRTQALEEAAKAVCYLCRAEVPFVVDSNYLYHERGVTACFAFAIWRGPAGLSTGEGAADSADSGEEDSGQKAEH